MYTCMDCYIRFYIFKFYVWKCFNANCSNMYVKREVSGPDDKLNNRQFFYYTKIYDVFTIIMQSYANHWEQLSKWIIDHILPLSYSLSFSLPPSFSFHPLSSSVYQSCHFVFITVPLPLLYSLYSWSTVMIQLYIIMTFTLTQLLDLDHFEGRTGAHWPINDA